MSDQTNASIHPDVQLAALVSGLGGLVTVTDKGAVEGVFALAGGFTFKVRRSHSYYLSASISPPLPSHSPDTVGYRVNHAPLPAELVGKRSGDSGTEPLLGSICRADGYGHGLLREHLTSCCKCGLAFWHVDLWEALGLLLSVLNREIEVGALHASDAEMEHRARTTDSFVRDFAVAFEEAEELRRVAVVEGRTPAEHSIIAELFLRDLTDQSVNESDPRIIALKERARKLVRAT